MASISPINSSSNGRNKKPLNDLVLDAFALNPRMSFLEVHDLLVANGYKAPPSNSISTVLAHLTNVGQLKQFGKNSDGNTVWERTALKYPMPDGGKIEIQHYGQLKELNTELVEVILGNMMGGLSSINNISKQGRTPDLTILPDYISQIKQILTRFKGFTDRTHEPEFIRRVAQGL